MSSYLIVHIAPMSVQYLANAKGKVSKKSILEGLKAHRDAEFVCVQTGKYLTVAEAKESGYQQLNVRYNNDRDLAVIDI